MEIKIESLVSYEKIKKHPDAVFKLVDKNDTVVILRNNQPAYVIVKYEAEVQKAENNNVMSAAQGTAAEDPAPKKRGRKPRNEASQPGRQAKAPKKKVEKTPRVKLQDAVKMILDETENKEMPVAELAEALYQRGLYAKRDGSKASAGQLRSRVANYKELFETLPGNIIKLKLADQ